MKRYWLAAGMTMVGIVATVATPHEAGAVQCGDVLAGPGSFSLSGSLTCSTPTALTVRDGATLDLRGHTVRCAGSDVGIAVAGTGARLLNGTVTGCGDGVTLSGDRLQVKRIRSMFNVRGFRAPGGLTRSRLQDSSAEFNAAGGIVVRGDGNLVTRNRSFGNGDTAVFLVGNANMLTRNATNGNCIAGGCAAAYVIGGEGNVVTRNTATAEDTGFLLGYGGAARNTLSRNKALFSFLAGIVVQDGATDNLLTRNEASGAGVHLFDFNEDCDANVWRRNTFTTANQPCIQ